MLTAHQYCCVPYSAFFCAQSGLRSALDLWSLYTAAAKQTDLREKVCHDRLARKIEGAPTQEHVYGRFRSFLLPAWLYGSLARARESHQFAARSVRTGGGEASEEATSPHAQLADDVVSLRTLLHCIHTPADS